MAAEQIAVLIEKRAREIARQEIASLCGLVLQTVSTRPVGVAVGEAVTSAFAEALRDYGGQTQEPGR